MLFRSWCLMIIIIMYIYRMLINALSAHMIHINLNMIFYTHVEHSPTKTIYIKHTHTQWLSTRMIHINLNIIFYSLKKRSFIVIVFSHCAGCSDDDGGWWLARWQWHDQPHAAPRCRLPPRGLQEPPAALQQHAALLPGGATPPAHGPRPLALHVRRHARGHAALPTAHDAAPGRE